ncbi:hypothetical protein SAMN05216353_1067 [Halobacillus alkaliphilus]|uniref:Inner spore coat protein n=1 Tax=Halobacillus alkaliphilus TaxID=396056 RepID=A0A1I2KSE8_9BACI|nr:hypothetical protein [Halobacillus alkaliphilus]SFF69875.1 hypothetical protein SAMN05216353_1067 [Halobacillus alkaliphilus]
MFYPYYYPTAYWPTFYVAPSYQSQAFAYRTYPEVNTKLLIKSAEQMKVLLKEAEVLMDHITSSPDLAAELMNAAQQSNKSKLIQLLKASGIQSKLDTSYTPDGLNIMLCTSVGDLDCGHLKISIRWR